MTASSPSTILLDILSKNVNFAIQTHSNMNIRTILIAGTVTLAASLTVKAQELTEGSYRALVGIRTACAQIDFSKATVDGIPFAEFAEYDGYNSRKAFREDYEEDILDLLGDFIEEFNDVESPIRLTVNRRVETRLDINVRKVVTNGSQFWADFVFWDKESGDVLASFYMEAEDGRVGSFMNLLGDAMEEAGEKLARHLKKNIRREIKQMEKSR